MVRVVGHRRRLLRACVCVGALLLPAALSAGPAFVRYADPAKQFTIEIPAGWHIKRGAGSVTVFYLDDPDEGTSLSAYVPPQSAVVRGEITAAQFFETYVYAPLHKQFPDYAVAGRESTTLAGTPADTLFVASASWTGARHAKLRGFIKIAAFKNTGRGTTWVTATAYQAPAASFGTVEPTLDRMMRSLAYGPGR